MVEMQPNLALNCVDSAKRKSKNHPQHFPCNRVRLLIGYEKVGFSIYTSIGKIDSR